MADQDYSGSIMIAFLPTNTEWCKIKLPHMTLVFAGEVKDHSPADFNSLAKDGSSIALLTRPFALEVDKVDVFGTDEKVNVLRFKPTAELFAIRRIVEGWNASEHPFNPHCTIGPYGMPVENVPKYVNFDKLGVYWGDEALIFNLKR